MMYLLFKFSVHVYLHGKIKYTCTYLSRCQDLCKSSLAGFCPNMDAIELIKFKHGKSSNRAEITSGGERQTIWAGGRCKLFQFSFH